MLLVHRRFYIRVLTIGKSRKATTAIMFTFISLYTGCPGGNVPDFGRMFLMLKYTDITQNTYIQS